MSELHDIDRRVAVLEEIARNTAEALSDIRAELRGLRADMRQQGAELRAEIRDLRGDFRWLLRVMIAGFVGLSAVMAHGFRWF